MKTWWVPFLGNFQRQESGWALTVRLPWPGLFLGITKVRR